MTTDLTPEHEQRLSIFYAMDLIHTQFSKDNAELNGHARRVLRRIAQRFPNSSVHHAGGRGMDHWTDQQVESQVRSYDDTIMSLEHQISKLQAQMRRLSDAYADTMEELQERCLDAEIDFYGEGQ